MKEGACECGNTFLIPNNTTEREVFFQREKPLELFFAGVDVGIKRNCLFEMCKKCATSYSLEMISLVITVDSDNGKVVVDWKAYQRVLQSSRYINNVLDKLGILSGDASGNWIIMSQRRGCINPMYGRSVNLYFTSPDDAFAYAEMCQVHRGHIMKVGDVMAV